MRSRAARLALALAFVGLLLAACDPVGGTGSGTPPDPNRFFHVDAAARGVVLTLIAGYPVTDYQFNYDGYARGALVVKVPVGWEVTVQCQNRGTVPNSCAVVRGSGDTAPLEPDWSTPEPVHGLQPGASASFAFTPTAAGVYRIASLVPGAEASGTWATLEITAGGNPSISAG